MISVSNSKNEKIFLTSKTKIDEKSISKNINVILSPEFYWVRKFEIPVKNEVLAKKVLPTLFEDIVNEKALSYQVIKLQENLFLCFAYSSVKVYEAIKSANITISKIKAIYFAQNECKDYKAFEINDERFYYTKDDILVKVPSNLALETINLNKVLKDINLSNKKLQIKLYNEILDKKVFVCLAFCLSIIALANFTKAYLFSDKIASKQKEIETLKQNLDLPTSLIQTQALLERNKNILNDERNKREALNLILNSKEFKLSNVFLENKEISLEYKSNNSKEIEKFLKAKFEILSLKQEENKVLARIKI